MPQPRKKQQNPSHTNAAIIIGQNLQAIRKKRGLTQKELAEAIGVTREAITAYEVGRVRILDCTLIDLAKVLKVSSDEILGLKISETDTAPISRRLMKRIIIVETLPETTKKHIIKNIDDAIRGCRK